MAVDWGGFSSNFQIRGWVRMKIRKIWSGLGRVQVDIIPLYYLPRSTCFILCFSTLYYHLDLAALTHCRVLKMSPTKAHFRHIKIPAWTDRTLIQIKPNLTLVGIGPENIHPGSNWSMKISSRTDRSHPCYFIETLCSWKRNGSLVRP